MVVKQVQTISKEGALLVTNRKFSMFVTVIGTALLAIYQLTTVILDNFQPGLIPCEILVYQTVCLHPVLTFCGSYVLLFLRQYFTLRTLRQTPLKTFIPALASPLSGITAFVMFCTGTIVITYLIVFDRKQEDRSSTWINLDIPGFTLKNVTNHKCLINSQVDIKFIALATFGNMALLFFCSFWETIPFVRYIWYRYSCTTPKVQKYVEILAFKETGYHTFIH